MKTIRSFLLLTAILTGLTCERTTSSNDRDSALYDWENHTSFKTDYSPFNLSFTDDFNPIPENRGEVAMSEASGIAWSMKNPGMIWAHNDQGHANNLFLIDSETGQMMARYTVMGTINLDWEDMEVSYGPQEDEYYIYLADTGDNNEVKPQYSIYRFPEPVYEEAHFGQTIRMEDVEVDHIQFQYPDGSHDTEAMLVDPLTLDIFLITKRDVVSTLYVLPYPQPVKELYTIFKAGEFSFREASAATASLSGDKVLIKNRQEIFYWQRKSGETMLEMLERTPVKAPYAGEPQGEAICFDPDYNYFTLSEALNSQTNPPLFKYTYKY